MFDGKRIWLSHCPLTVSLYCIAKATWRTYKWWGGRQHGQSVHWLGTAVKRLCLEVLNKMYQGVTACTNLLATWLRVAEVTRIARLQLVWTLSVSEKTAGATCSDFFRLQKRTHFYKEPLKGYCSVIEGRNAAGRISLRFTSIAITLVNCFHLVNRLFHRKRGYFLCQAQ